MLQASRACGAEPGLANLLKGALRLADFPAYPHDFFGLFPSVCGTRKPSATMLRLMKRACRPPTGAQLKISARAWPQLAPTVAEAFRERSTFVSKHHVLDLAVVTAFLNQRGMQFRTSGAEVVVKECPFCHDTGGKVDNVWKLYIGLEKG